MRRPSYLLAVVLAAFLGSAAFAFKLHLFGVSPNDDELFRRLFAGALFVTAVLFVRLAAVLVRRR